MTISIDNHDLAVSSISFIMGILLCLIFFVRDEPVKSSTSKSEASEELDNMFKESKSEIKWTSYSSGSTYKCNNCKDTGRVLDVDGTISCKSCKRSSE